MLRPLGDRVIISEEKPEEMTSFGLVIPDSAKEKPCIGTIVAKGDGRRASQVEVGDRILYSKWGGQEIRDNDATRYVLEAKDIYGILLDVGPPEPCVRGSALSNADRLALGML